MPLRILFRSTALLFVLTGITCCRPGSVYEGKVDFSRRVWASGEVVEFDFTIADPSAPYDLYYTIRNTNEYPYQNIYLQYFLTDSSGLLLRKELNNVLLFNAVTGVPLGNGIGDIFVLQKKFLEQYNFEHAGVYRLRIDHYMRSDTLPEVASVGIVVKKSGS
jgi:gliding motility-associated lipoprotein GldH